MPVTARDIIQLALKECGVLGVGQTALAEDINDGLTLLRRMMAQWKKRNLMVPAKVDIFKNGNNAVSNTIGTGGYWDVPRPVDVFAGYVIQRNTGQTPVSLPMVKIYSYEDYARIALKNLNSVPDHFFYDGHYPYGNVFIWPIPSSIWECHLIIPMDLSFPAGSLNTVFDMPEDYEEAIHYNLAFRMCSMYQRPASKELVELKNSSVKTIKVGNTQISTLMMPTTLRSNRGFNIYNPDGY